MRAVLLALALAFLPSAAGAKARIKDVAQVRGVRDVQLVGYGLVVGLRSSGDTLRNSIFTEQALQSMLDRMGVAVKTGAMRTRNVAAVMVTADIPAFAGVGSKIDVTVSSLGDATSLMGGTLIMTPLVAADGAMYAAAQGAVSVTGYSETGKSETVTQGVPTAGRIVNGATIERDPPSDPVLSGQAILELRNPDFATAVRVADAINAVARKRIGRPAARERDNRTIAVDLPAQPGGTRFLAEIGEAEIEPDTPARVVIDARSGTVVIGADVKVTTVAVTHGALSVRISDNPVVSQPAPFSQGRTVIGAQTAISAEQSGGQLALLSGANLRTLVRGLNQIGVKPDGIIAILQAIKTAGALQADIVVQ